MHINFNKPGWGLVVLELMKALALLDRKMHFLKCLRTLSYRN